MVLIKKKLSLCPKVFEVCTFNYFVYIVTFAEVSLSCVSVFLPVVPGTIVGFCVGNGCPVIEPIGNGCPVKESVGVGCPVIEPVVDSVWEAVLIILHLFNEMVVFT